MNRGSIIVLLSLIAIVAAAGLSMAQEPVVRIDSIEPSPAYDTDIVRFTGDWTYDGDIEGYLWESSLDGPLSWEASFEVSDLSVGTHFITFKVQNEESLWSEPVNKTLEVIDYILEAPPWKNGDVWLWNIYMRDSDDREETMYVIEHVKDINADYTGYPCYKVDLTYTIQGETDIIEGTVWLSRDTLEPLGYDIEDLDEPFGAYEFLPLLGFPVDVSEGSFLFDTQIAPDKQVGNTNYSCIEMESLGADIVITYSPEARHIVRLESDVDGEILEFIMEEALDVEAAYSVLPEDPGPNNGNGGGNGGGGNGGGSGDSFLDSMFMTMMILIVVVIIGGAAAFVFVKRRGAQGDKQPSVSSSAAVHRPPPPLDLSEGSVMDGTYEFQRAAPEKKSAQATSGFLSFDGPPGSLGGPASPTSVAADAKDVGAPGGFRVVPDGPVNKLYWAPSKVEGGASISFYKVYRGTSHTEMAVYQTVGSEVLNFEDDNIVEGAVYHYKVSAETISGEGPASETVATVQADAPAAPVYPISRVEGSNVFLEWKLPPSDGGSPITGYRIHKGPSPYSLEEVASTEGTERVFADTEVAEGTHYYAITAETASSGSPPSKVIEVKVQGSG